MPITMTTLVGWKGATPAKVSKNNPDPENTIPSKPMNFLPNQSERYPNGMTNTN